MEAANGAHITHSNKVIVQCSDPSNIYDKVQPLLEARLPLRTLHWKSATRPLRSIDELDVTLVRDDGAASETTGHARRHQIPGLRQTPYVKLLLLRCDDKETYKESVRKDAKAWVKGLDVSTSGKPTVKGHERHDAYEYIIVHVVFPDTPAALQPKSSKHISVADTDSTDSVNSTNKSKWTGKSTSTIYDKLRADFHSSSKAPFERVAQVRITDPQKPSSALGPLDIEQQWNDLVDKLKTAILQSFDARVAQYEEDIREREVQRALPGWNFCTFFILKEGLARGFENVGLLEDALSVYEELDAGLDGIILEQAKDGEADAMNALLPYASNLKSTIRSVLENKANRPSPANANGSIHMLDTWMDLDKDNLPLSLERRNYQQMILTNQVCALDFRIYIFIRQFQILLRRAVIPESTKSGKRQHEVRYDAAILAVISERSLKFINFAARNLRQDLFAAWGGSDALPEHEQHDQQLIIDNIVASWKWSACVQILHECQIARTIVESFARLDESSFTHEELLSPQVLNKSADLARDRALSVTSTSTDASLPHDANRSTSLPIVTTKNIRGQRESWIFWAAEIFETMRTILAQLKLARGSIPGIRDNDDGAPPLPDSYDELRAVGLLAPSLRHATYLYKNTSRAFRLLTVSACQCYIVVGRKRIAKALLLELAQEDARHEQYTSAAGWLSAIDGLLEREPGDKLDETSLDLYAQCLMHLDRPIERVRCLLSCMRSVAKDRSVADIQELFQNVLQPAAQLDEIQETFDGIFDLAQIDTFVKHTGSPHRPTLKLVLRLLLPITVPEIKASLVVKARDSSDVSPIEFTYRGIPSSDSSKIEIEVQSDVSTFGWYEVDHLELRIGRLFFYHNLKVQHLIEDDEGFKIPGSQNFMSRDVYMYPSPTSPFIDARHADAIDLSSRRSVSIALNWRSSNVEKAVLRLKPSTAGFRLDLQSTKHQEGTELATFAVRRINDVLVLEFDDIRGISTFLDIPFTLDTSTQVTTASISSHLTYTMAGTTLQTYQTLSVSTLLPISVNVQDVFQASATFCRFTIAPSTNEPVVLVDCTLRENSNYAVTAPTGFDAIGTLAVFSRQPASWIAKITPRPKNDVVSAHGADEKLQLCVRYACMGEIVTETVLQTFEADLASSDVAYTIGPLRTHLVERLKTLWSELDMELITLTEVIHLWSFDSFDWSAILFAFDKITRSSVVSWLRQWHSRRATINIQGHDAQARSLRLMVDIPKAEIIVTTQMKLHTAHTVAIGKPISARVTLCCTRNAVPTPETEITFEILAPSDSWLIGGKRKGRFQADQERYEVILILVPQKVGQLLLPSIEVKCANTSGVLNATKSINLDTEHLSAATSVFVVPGLELTSIGINNAESEANAAGHGHSGGDNWLIGSKRRSAVL